jgi:chromosome partitioning protein
MSRELMRDSMSWRLGRSVRDRVLPTRGEERADDHRRARAPGMTGWTAASGPPPVVPPAAEPTTPLDDGPAVEAAWDGAPERDAADPAPPAADPPPPEGSQPGVRQETPAATEPAPSPHQAPPTQPPPAPGPEHTPTDVSAEAAAPVDDGQAPAATASAASSVALEEGEDRQRHATVVCVANQKGGVGKTTTTVSVAAALAEIGARVLVVDLDPQGNATTGLGLRAEEGDPSTYAVLVDGMAVDEAVLTTDVEGLDVLPSSLDLAGAEVELVPAFSRELRLRKALDTVRSAYDVVFVDCPPSLGLLTINALVAADQVLVPIQCEYYALEGLGQLMRTVKLVGDNLNRELELGGVVLTMYDGRTNLSQQVVDEVKDYFGDRAYGTIIPRTVRLSEAPSFGQPITVFDPSSRGARAYDRLAREMAERLGLHLAEQEPEISPLDRLLGSSAPPPPRPAATAVSTPQHPDPYDPEQEGQP